MEEIIRLFSEFKASLFTNFTIVTKTYQDLLLEQVPVDCKVVPMWWNELGSTSV